MEDADDNSEGIAADPRFVAANERLAAARERELLLATERAGIQQRIAALQAEYGSRRGPKPHSYKSRMRGLDGQLARNMGGYLVGEPDREDHPSQQARASSSSEPAASDSDLVQRAGARSCGRVCVRACARVRARACLRAVHVRCARAVCTCKRPFS